MDAAMTLGELVVCPAVLMNCPSVQLTNKRLACNGGLSRLAGAGLSSLYRGSLA